MKPHPFISSNIQAVVLAAGMGSRMESDLHKVLHELAGKPMLTHVLDNLKELNVRNTVVIVGAGREQILDAFPHLTTVIQDEQLGTGHAVLMAKELMAEFNGITLVLYGDVPLVSSKTMQVLCEKVQSNTCLSVLGFRPEDTLAYGRLVTDENGQLECIVEHAEANDIERKVGFCNSGILAGKSDVLFDLLDKITNDNSKGEYYLTDVVGLAREAGYQVATAEADPLEVTGVNSKAELAALNRLLRAG